MVGTILHRWVTPNSTYLGVGLGCWVLCSGAAAFYAARFSLDLLPTIVTWNEWLIAIILIPALLNVGAPRVRARLVWVRWIAATVFAMDLLVRAFFGLGWQPFL